MNNKQIMKLMSLLLESTKQSRATIKEAVFEDIVALCRGRILARLRVNRTGNGGRYIAQQLDAFLQSSWQERAHKLKISASSLKEYEGQAKTLLDHLYSFKNSSRMRQGDLVDLVRHISEFVAQVPIRDLCQGLADHDMAASDRERLVGCLSKVSRYRESASILVRRTKKIEILRNVAIQTVSLENAAFERVLPSEYRPHLGLGGVLDRVSQKGSSLRVHQLPSWTQKGQDDFSMCVQTILETSKIHAEIQILAHYEDHASGNTLPRIIAASKDACYFCDTVIRLHGKFTVPETHGKLYPGWRLPATPQFASLQEKLIGFIEQQIRASVATLSNAARRPKESFATESTCFPLNLTASTLTVLSNLSTFNLVAGRAGQAADRLVSSASDHGPFHLTEDASCLGKGEREGCAWRVDDDSMCGHISDSKTNSSVIDDGVRARDTFLSCDPARPSQDEGGPGLNNRRDAVRYQADALQSEGDETGSLHAFNNDDVDSHGVAQPHIHRFRFGNLVVYLESSTYIAPSRLSVAESQEILRRAVGIVDVLDIEAGGPIVPLRKTQGGRVYIVYSGSIISIDIGED